MMLLTSWSRGGGGGMGVTPRRGRPPPPPGDGPAGIDGVSEAGRNARPVVFFDKRHRNLGRGRRVS